jgi:hypothetical protein
MNISDTFFFMSSIEAPKLQRLPETFVPSTKKTLLLKEQAKYGLFKQGNFDMSDTPCLERPCCASGGIRRGLSIERNLTVTAERYYHQLRRLEEAIQQKRPGGLMTWSDSSA